jgi:hypothetical protein
MSDQLVYDLSQQTEGAPSVFVRKDWLSLLDNQNGSYSGNSSVIDTSQLSNSNRYMGYADAYLQVPMIMTLTADTVAADSGAFAPATAATTCDYAVGLKNWFGSMIHSIQTEWNGVTVTQQTNFIGLYNTFKLMTTLSYNDILTQSSAIGFYPDDALSVIFNAAATVNGIGTGFTQNAMSVPVVTGVHSTYNSGNIGFFKRQQFINYDPAGLTAPTADAFSTLLPAASCTTAYKSYIFNKTNGVNAASRGSFQIAINAIVRLKHLHSLYEKMPLLKGVYLKITLQLNNSVVSFSSAAAGAAPTLISATSGVGGVVPIQIASAAAGNGSVAAFGYNGNYTCSLAVGATCLVSSQLGAGGVTASPLGRNITLNVPSYVMSPAFEAAYLSAQVKTIEYEDLYQYQVLSIGAAGGTINSLITNGISNISKVLVLPYFTATANGAISPLYSPFDGAGTGVTSPLCLLSNFQVVVSGQNALYNTQKYSYQQFMEQLTGCNSVNGNETDGLCSGLISQLDFETAYCYYYVDVSRMLEIEKSVPKSISIQGINLSAKAIDLIVFVAYTQTLKVDVLTGNRL